VSDLDRQRAVARVEELAAEGYIRDVAERERRLHEVAEADSWRELDAALAGLEDGRRRSKSGDRRVADADRKDAIRRLRVHGSMGHLDEGELEVRVKLVEKSKTPNEIAAVFGDLPELADVSKSAEPRISTQDKSEALDKLRKARTEGRIEDGEYEDAISQVTVARTQSELDAAFRCLPDPPRAEVATQAAKQTAAFTARAVAEGGRRASRAFLRFLFSGAALLIGVILLIAGVGIGAVLFFVAAVLLFVWSAASLVSRGRPLA
jgi:hypothetical protein